MEDFSRILDPTQVTTDAEFEEAWEQYLRQAPGQKPLTLRSRPTKVPRVGTTTERSSNRPKKIEALMQVPPRLPPRPMAPSEQKKRELKELFGDLSDLSDNEATSSTSAPPPAEYGPAGPPPVKVKIDGHELLIPYFAVTIGRKYKARIGDKKLLLRFNSAGECTFVRKLECGSDQSSSLKRGE